MINLLHTRQIKEDITYCTNCKVRMQMSPVIRFAFRLSRRLDLCNAIQTKSPIVVMFAFVIRPRRGVALQI